MEYELKYKLPEKWDVEVYKKKFLSAYEVEYMGTESLSAFYYDTKDGDLSAARWAFRLRKENQSLLVTLKGASNYSGAFSARPEFEKEVNNFDPNDLDASLEAFRQLCVEEKVQMDPFLLKDVLKKGFIKVGWCRFQRARFNITDDKGQLIEMAVDKGLLGYEDDTEIIAEIEFELKSGETDFLFTLSQETDLEPMLRNKFGRVLDCKRRRNL